MCGEMIYFISLHCLTKWTCLTVTGFGRTSYYLHNYMQYTDLQYLTASFGHVDFSYCNSAQMNLILQLCIYHHLLYEVYYLLCSVGFISVLPSIFLW